MCLKCLKSFTFGLEISHTSPRMLALNFHGERKLRTGLLSVSFPRSHSFSQVITTNRNTQACSFFLSLALDEVPSQAPWCLVPCSMVSDDDFISLGSSMDSLRVFTSEDASYSVMKMLGRNDIQLTISTLRNRSAETWPSRKSQGSGLQVYGA